MPFAEDYRAGFRDVIEPAVREAGLECVRADQEPLGQIHSRMFERIFDSAAVVADISGANPNVFYELGVSHGVARRTVTVAREDFIDRVPFDIAPYRVLVYPRPPSQVASDADRGVYEKRARDASERLAAELRSLRAEGSRGIANPVQDFLAARSPLTSTGSLYLDRFESGVEEEMLRGVDGELVCVALTGASFAGLLAGHVESGERTSPLAVRLLLLDPHSREGWSYVYHLREGRPISGTELEELMATDRASQARTDALVKRLNRRPDFDGEVVYYSGIPLFWAYLLDRRRLIVGHLAMERVGARNLPVSVLVGDDPRTESLYAYYTSVIESLSGRRSLAALGDSPAAVDGDQ